MTTTLINQARTWATKNSLWYYEVGSLCCPNELPQVEGCRYDLERLGCLPTENPESADVLIVYGAITRSLAPLVQQIYERMQRPKYVVAVGACACSGGNFSDAVVRGVGEILPVDVFVAGCPPRPEALMHGILTLREKIQRVAT
jgi:NADH-quinone oxidoreductase subunit B